MQSGVEWCNMRKNKLFVGVGFCGAISYKKRHIQIQIGDFSCWRQRAGTGIFAE
jgi:hypothetical protein